MLVLQKQIQVKPAGTIFNQKVTKRLNKEVIQKCDHQL